MRLVGAIATLAVLLVPGLAHAQAATTPPFTVGDVVVYAHATEDSQSVWMSTLQDDGEWPYYIFGEGTVPGVAGQTPSLDPVAQEAFEVRIALTPALAQDLVLKGTVKVDAFIGGGSATAGRAMIGTALAIAGTEVGAAEEKEHVMTRKDAGVTYDPISWTFDIPETKAAKGATVEWILRGTVDVGNNVYLAAHEARGRSAITLPVTALPKPASAGNDGGASGSLDSDADGLNDTWERASFGGLNETATGDPDADGLDNAAEQKAGTDPSKADTDGDGATDGAEAKAGTDPKDATSTPPPATTTSSSTAPKSVPSSTSSTSSAAAADSSKDTPIPFVLAPLALLAVLLVRRRLA